MATTAYSTLRQTLNKRLNMPWTGTTTGAGSASSLVCTGLQAWDQAKDDYYNDMWVRVTSGDASGNERLISDYTASSGTITPRPNFSATPGSSVTFEVMPHDPAMILEAFKRAIDTAYFTNGRKGLFRQVFDESNSTGNWLWNAHFEDWNLTTIPDHWVKQGTATVSEETTIMRGPKGSSAVKLTGGGATDYIYQSQTENPGLLNLQKHTVTFYVYAYAAAASTARLTVAYKVASDAALTTTSSSYHSGNSEFELLQEEVTFPEDVTDVQVRLESGGGTVYFDNLFMKNGPYCYRYHLGKDFAHKPEMVWVQNNDGTGTDNYGVTMLEGGEQWYALPASAWAIEDNGTDRMLVFGGNSYITAACRKIKVMGLESLSTPTTDASTVEVSGEQMRTLVELAVAELFDMLADSGHLSDDEVKDYRAGAARIRPLAEDMLRQYGMAKPYNAVRMTVG